MFLSSVLAQLICHDNLAALNSSRSPIGLPVKLREAGSLHGVAWQRKLPSFNVLESTKFTKLLRLVPHSCYRFLQCFCLIHIAIALCEQETRLPMTQY
jgi:hypothetical protein